MAGALLVQSIAAGAGPGRGRGGAAMLCTLAGASVRGLMPW